MTLIVGCEIFRLLEMCSRAIIIIIIIIIIIACPWLNIYGTYEKGAAYLTFRMLSRPTKVCLTTMTMFQIVEPCCYNIISNLHLRTLLKCASSQTTGHTKITLNFHYKQYENENAT